MMIDRLTNAAADRLLRPVMNRLGSMEAGIHHALSVMQADIGHDRKPPPPPKCDDEGEELLRMFEVNAASLADMFNSLTPLDGQAAIPLYRLDNSFIIRIRKLQDLARQAGERRTIDG